MTLSLIGTFGGCSAGGTPSSSAGVGNPGSGNAPILPGGPSGPGSTPGNPDLLIGDGDSAIDPNGRPLNIGSELACDGIDENQNGVTDDVDKGKDGLCDCLRIGFLGALASSNGQATGAFETWLEDRSDVPVAHIGARDTISADALKDLQVLVIGNLAERANSGGFSAAEVEALHQWVSEGGGVMSLAGYTANENDMAPTVALLAPLGLGYDYKTRGSGEFRTVVGPPPVIVHGILAPDHPTMEGITALGVFNAYPVVGDGQVIVRDGGFDLAMAKELGLGHVFVFSDEWITQDVLWNPMMNRPQTPCQQQCTQCANQCANCDTQCTNCQNQPCQGGQIVPDGGTCVRGCDQGCTSCSTNCQTCEQACTACSALEQDDKLDIPRFWLNVLRWLTPANECQVPVPPTIVY